MFVFAGKRLVCSLLLHVDVDGYICFADVEFNYLCVWRQDTEVS